MIKKRGLSAIIATILLVALTIIIVAIVWNLVSNLVRTQTQNSEACFGVNGQVFLNPSYTCYNDTSNELMFYVNVGDIDINDILVSIRGQGTSATFKINENLNKLILYPGLSMATGIPGKNQGLTYIYNLTTLSQIPDSVEIAPIINGQQCQTSSVIDSLDLCSTLAS